MSGRGLRVLIHDLASHDPGLFSQRVDHARDAAEGVVLPVHQELRSGHGRVSRCSMEATGLQ